MTDTQKTNLDFSQKDIPIPGRFEYQKKLTHSVERLLKKLGWAIHFILHPDDKPKKDTYGFKSHAAPPAEAIKILEPLTKDLAHLVRTLEYRNPKRNEHQMKLHRFLKKMKESDKIMVPADKTKGYYQVNTEDYLNLMRNNVTATYQRAEFDEVTESNMEAMKLAQELELSDRIQVHSENPAFVSLKDHKDNFRSRETARKPCRLINPAKPDIGKLSKTILQDVNKEIRGKTGLNQWQSTDAMLRWYKRKENKKTLRFFKFDVESFYPSISANLLENAINWARTLRVEITARDERIIMTARRNFLFYNGSAWKKKQNPNFDVTMGSFDGAEVCEIVGLFLLNEMIENGLGITKDQVGLYRDDGLMLLRKSKRELDTMRKKLHLLFASFGLKITAETGMKQTDFLDTTLHLEDGSFEPFRKDDAVPTYVNRRSNHPPSITKHLPEMIEKRLNSRCSSKKIFDQHKHIYEAALKKSGYETKLNYKPEEETRTKKKPRYKQIYWFNPPYNMKVKTKLGQEFLRLIDKNFPKGTVWYQHFNRHTVKVSYSCTKNIAAHISSHNKKVLNSTRPQKPCNCRAEECPVNGECQKEGVVYEATLESEKKQWIYFGSTGNTFKERYAGHKQDLKNQTRAGTTLSNKYWELKTSTTRKPEEPTLKWKIIHTCHKLKAGMPICDVCLTEKTRILLQHEGPDPKPPPQAIILNQRNELFAKCRHRRKFTLLNCRNLYK